MNKLTPKQIELVKSLFPECNTAKLYHSDVIEGSKVTFISVHEVLPSSNIVHHYYMIAALTNYFTLDGVPMVMYNAFNHTSNAIDIDKFKTALECKQHTINRLHYLLNTVL
jgi:hypothetical protein